MNSNIKSSAELFIATGCSHCPIVLTELTEQLKKGQLSSLHVTNIAVDNDKAAELGIRSVPWFSLSNENSYMIFSYISPLKLLYVAIFSNANSSTVDFKRGFTFLVSYL